MWAIQPGSALADGESQVDAANARSGADPEEDENEQGFTPNRKRLRYYESAELSRNMVANKEVGGKRANRNSCFLCGAWDHHASSCPNERCIICLQSGHQIRDCPKAKRPVVCSTCGRVGHSQGDCTIIQELTTDVANCRCIACGAHGHLSCTPFEKRPKNISCFNCGKRGHQANDCREDGFDRWQRVFVQSLGDRDHGARIGFGRGGILSQHRGPPPASISLEQLMSSQSRRHASVSPPRHIWSGASTSRAMEGRNRSGRPP